MVKTPVRQAAFELRRAYPAPAEGGRPPTFDGLAAAVLDDRRTVAGWTGTAQDLTGFRADEPHGRSVRASRRPPARPAGDVAVPLLGDTV